MSLFAFEHQDALAKRLAEQLNVRFSPVTCHRFPDEECSVCIVPESVTETSIIVASLSRPDLITLPLVYLARTLRDYGTTKIILVAPYLAYMRQDKRFNPGEGITARYYAELLSAYVDALITVDPHLHRIHDLGEVYTIETSVVRAATRVSEWIKSNVSLPLIVGPDSESEQWVKKLAELVAAPYLVLEKTRHGDREVEISAPQFEQWQQHTPVLFDDIISTGQTMIETVKHVNKSGMQAPTCIGVHAVFADDAYRHLREAGASPVVTCNTIEHGSNAIDLSSDIVQAIRHLS